MITSPPGKPPVQGYYLFALPDDNGGRPERGEHFLSASENWAAYAAHI